MGGSIRARSSASASPSLPMHLQDSERGEAAAEQPRPRRFRDGDRDSARAGAPGRRLEQAEIDRIVAPISIQEVHQRACIGAIQCAIPVEVESGILTRPTTNSADQAVVVRLIDAAGSDPPDGPSGPLVPSGFDGSTSSDATNPA